MDCAERGLLALGEIVVEEDAPPVCHVVAPVPAVCPALRLPSAHGPMVRVVPWPSHLKDGQHLNRQASDLKIA